MEMLRRAIASLSRIYDALEDRWTRLHLGRGVATLLVVSFVGALVLIELNRHVRFPAPVEGVLPTNHFRAVDFAFTLLLLVEVLGLVWALVGSFANCWRSSRSGPGRGSALATGDDAPPFFETFHTLLIFADVGMVLIPLRCSSRFDVVLRNSGFAASTLMVRLSLTAPDRSGPAGPGMDPASTARHGGRRAAPDAPPG